MALYLGSEKLAITTHKIFERGIVSDNYASGTVISNSDGVITFPELDFTPIFIAVWNLKLIDLKAEAEENGGDWEDDFVRYIHKGIMLFAVYQDGIWVTQSLHTQSGSMYISNESHSYGSSITQNGNVYVYDLNNRNDQTHTGVNEEFTYVILG